LKNLGTLKTQLGNYSMHGKFELDPDQEIDERVRAPRVEFVDNENDNEHEDNENNSIQEIKMDVNGIECHKDQVDDIINKNNKENSNKINGSSKDKK